MYRTTEKETRLFVLKIVIIGLLMFMSFVVGLFINWIFLIVTIAAGGVIVWESISYSKESGRKNN